MTGVDTYSYSNGNRTVIFTSGNYRYVPLGSGYTINPGDNQKFKFKVSGDGVVFSVVPTANASSNNRGCMDGAGTGFRLDRTSLKWFFNGSQQETSGTFDFVNNSTITVEVFRNPSGGETWTVSNETNTVTYTFSAAQTSGNFYVAYSSNNYPRECTVEDTTSTSLIFNDSTQFKFFAAGDSISQNDNNANGTIAEIVEAENKFILSQLETGWVANNGKSAVGIPRVTEGPNPSAVVLVGSPYFASSPDLNHTSTDWQVTTPDDTSFSSPVTESLEDITSKRQWSLFVALEPLSTYICRVRYRSESGAGALSEWSAVSTFTTANTTIAMPPSNVYIVATTGSSADFVDLSGKGVVDFSKKFDKLFVTTTKPDLIAIQGGTAEAPLGTVPSNAVITDVGYNGTIYYYTEDGKLLKNTANNSSTGSTLDAPDISGINTATQYNDTAIAWSNTHRKIYVGSNGSAVAFGSVSAAAGTGWRDVSDTFNAVTFDYNPGVDIKQIVAHGNNTNYSAMNDPIILFKDGEAFYSASNTIRHPDSLKWTQISPSITATSTSVDQYLLLDEQFNAYTWGYNVNSGLPQYLTGGLISVPMGGRGQAKLACTTGGQWVRVATNGTKTEVPGAPIMDIGYVKTDNFILWATCQLNNASSNPPFAIFNPI